MDEREEHKLTLLAGKAAGLTLQYSNNCGDWSTGEPYGPDDKRWNPLKFNDHAFQLMLQLGISLDPGPDSVCAITPNHYSVVIEPAIGSQLQIAARVAIVRAAASLAPGLSFDEIRVIDDLLGVCE